MGIIPKSCLNSGFGYKGNFKVVKLRGVKDICFAKKAWYQKAGHVSKPLGVQETMAVLHRH